jgi:hypothetical protein
MQLARALTVAIWFGTGIVAQAQSRIRFGAILTTEGRPVAGASVNVRCGSTAVTRVTDSAGVFSIDDPGDADCAITVVTPWSNIVTRTVHTYEWSLTAVRIVVAADPMTKHDARSDDERLSLSLSEGSLKTDSLTDRAVHLGGPWSVKSRFVPRSGSSQAGFGSEWITKTTAHVQVGRFVQLGVGVIGRRGYDRPLFMAEPLGSDAIAFSGPGFYFDTSNAPFRWDTEVRITKRIASTRSVYVDAVGEALNLFSVTQPTSSSISSSPTINAEHFDSVSSSAGDD